MLAKKFTKLLLITILSLFFSSNSFSIEPKDFVQQTVDKAAKALDQNLSKDLKISKLKVIALKAVDIKGIGFYSLGKHRKNLTDTQKKEYSEVFKSYFLESFSSRLAEYSNPVIEVNSKEKISDNYTIVSSTLAATDKRPAIKIDWRIYTKNPNKPLIRDLIIEGLSLARTQKEEFNSIIQSADGDVEALFINLKEFSNR